MPAAPRLTAHADTLPRLRQTVYDRTGIWFSDAKLYLLESRCTERAAALGCKSLEDYHRLLEKAAARGGEFQALCDRITVNETSFFRNPNQLSRFENDLLPALIAARSGTRRLRLWSAACSTGEEPYTLAVIVRRALGVRAMDWGVEIVGTDLSERALAAARAGRYGRYAVRGLAPDLIARHFAQNGASFDLDPELRSAVRFQHHNLCDAAGARALGQFDAVFCRNAMIYFDEPMRRRCHRLFHRALAPDGVLLIGHSEAIREDDLFTPTRGHNCFAYHPRAGAL